MAVPVDLVGEGFGEHLTWVWISASASFAFSKSVMTAQLIGFFVDGKLSQEIWFFYFQIYVPKFS